MSIQAIPKDYYGHKTELFLDNLCNQESDNLRDHKQQNDKLKKYAIICLDKGLILNACFLKDISFALE